MKRSQCRNWKHTEMLVMKAGRGIAILKAKHGWPLINIAIYLLSANTQTKSFWQGKGQVDGDTCVFEGFVGYRWWCWILKVDFCNIFVKGKASGSGTLTTIAWMAPLTPLPERSGLKSLMTPVTQGNVPYYYVKQRTIIKPNFPDIWNYKNSA